MGKIGATVKGSSLVEVTVAMVILTLTVAAAFAILLGLSKAGNMKQQLKWQTMAEAFNGEAISSGALLDEEIQEGEVRLSRRIEPYETAANVVLVETNIMSEAGDTLARQRELVYVAGAKN